MEHKLWTHDFTIITLGTVVSMLGNAISGFAIGLLVLDYSGSVFLYSLFMVAYNAPKIIMPLIAGPYLDRFSRKKMIYTLDFLSAGLYLVLAGLIFWGDLRYGALLFFSLFIGIIDSIYEVAYDSLYPNLISPGNYRQAYSISSLIFPLAAAMVPVSAFVYNTVGMAPLFLFNSVSFLIAAIFETKIEYKEEYVAEKRSFDLREFGRTFKEGIDYIRGEPGLLVITVYFFFSNINGGATNLTLPYFKSVPSLGVYAYCIVFGAYVVGRFAGGLIQYRLRYPPHKKFAIAVFVYTAICLLDGSYLFLPLVAMTAVSFVSGTLSVNSYNIRVAATQSYVPDSCRARFNGTFQMVCFTGSIIGQLTAGALGDIMSMRTVIVMFNAMALVATAVLMLPARAKVAPIYNRDI